MKIEIMLERLKLLEDENERLRNLMENASSNRVRYVVEHYTSFSGEWFPKFCCSLDSAIDYKERLFKLLKAENKKFKYRIIKEVVTSEIIEEGDNFVDSSEELL